MLALLPKKDCSFQEMLKAIYQTIIKVPDCFLNYVFECIHQTGFGPYHNIGKSHKA